MESGEAKQIICTLLRHEAAEWDANAGPSAVARFLDVGHDHGVLPLIDAELRSRADGKAWPDEIRAACRERARFQAAYELAHRTELSRLLGAFAAGGIKSVLLKGTGLAYGLYPDAILRPRVDTDLLVAPDTGDEARRVLEVMGYRRVIGPAGRFVGYQVAMHHIGSNGARHAIDLHWRISDLQSFAWLFSFDDLAAAAVPVASLDARAWRLGNPHTLIHCVLHRFGNNRFQEPGFGDRLIWLYDMKLLVERMSDAELRAFVQLVETKRLGAIAIDGLRACAQCFGSPRLSALIARMESEPGAAFGEAFLRAGRLRREWIEFRALPAAEARLSWLAERILPGRDYMREQYSGGGTDALPVLHLRRWIGGLRKLVLAGRP